MQVEYVEDKKQDLFSSSRLNVKRHFKEASAFAAGLEASRQEIRESLPEDLIFLDNWKGLITSGMITEEEFQDSALNSIARLAEDPSVYEQLTNAISVFIKFLKLRLERDKTSFAEVLGLLASINPDCLNLEGLEEYTKLLNDFRDETELSTEAIRELGRTFIENIRASSFQALHGRAFNELDPQAQFSDIIPHILSRKLLNAIADVNGVSLILDNVYFNPNFQDVDFMIQRMKEPMYLDQVVDYFSSLNNRQIQTLDIQRVKTLLRGLAENASNENEFAQIQIIIDRLHIFGDTDQSWESFLGELESSRPVELENTPEIPADTFIVLENLEDNLYVEPQQTYRALTTLVDRGFANMVWDNINALTYDSKFRILNEFGLLHSLYKVGMVEQVKGFVLEMADVLKLPVTVEEVLDMKRDEIKGLVALKLGEEFDLALTDMLSKLGFVELKFLYLILHKYGIFSQEFIDFLSGRSKAIEIRKRGSSLRVFNGARTGEIENIMPTEKANTWFDLAGKGVGLVSINELEDLGNGQTRVSTQHDGIDLTDLITMLGYVDFSIDDMASVESGGAAPELPFERIELYYGQQNELFNEIAQKGKKILED